MANDNYRNFLNTAAQKGLLQEFDEADLKLAEKNPEFGTSLMYLKEKYKNSTTDEQKALAHEAANQLRTTYSTMGATGTAGGGTYGSSSPGTGGTNYSSRLSSALKDITGSTYEQWKQGDAYKELKNDYEAQGQKAMQDTLAQMSGRTGGMASSYAGSAAQGSYNDYMQALNEAAYNRYQNELGQKMDNYSLLVNADNTEYSRMLDSLDREQQAAALEREISAEERAQAQDIVNTMISYGVSAEQIPADILEKSGYFEGYVTAGSNAVKRAEQAGTAEQALAAAYGGDFSKLAAYYGTDEATARKFFYANYGSSGSGSETTEAVQESKTYEPYTRQQMQNYETIRKGLLKQVQANDSYEPLNYIRRLEQTQGEDYYKKLIGEQLYDRLINEMEQYSYENRKTGTSADGGSSSGGSTDNMGALYSAMMSAEDPEAWLAENSAYMTQAELEAALGWLNG